MSSPANQPSRIILTGFSGTGKTAVGPIIAERLGWKLLDTDGIVERRARKSIPEIFRDNGEERFRELEAEALATACGHENAVISTGGGAVLSPENRTLMARSGFIVCLEARPETILRRLGAGDADEPLDRPLLASGDPFSRIRDLKRTRQHLYALCDWTVHTDEMTPDAIADEVIRAWEGRAESAMAGRHRVNDIGSPEAGTPATVRAAIPRAAAAIVRGEAGEYPVFVEWGALSSLGRRLREMGLSRHIYVITDEQVAHHYEDEVETALRGTEIPFDTFTIAPGEASKTLETASRVYDWLLDCRAERGHAVVAVGGGVVTDLGGFVAATFARGLPLVHVPTSLLGMVDAAIGGKVAVNHPKAKNMIGAFYQPRMVLADPAVLRTLPPRDIRQGWAEAIKHAMIADEEYLRFFEENADAILKLQQDVTVEAIRRSVAIKARVVTEDEREEKGIRSFLNYGHTLAHAIESTTGYQRFRHGEADGIGMTAAARMSEMMGLLSHEAVDRQRRVLKRYGLPAHAEGLDRERIIAAVALDKKVVGKAVRWVLLEGIGRPVLRDDVPADVVQRALDEVLR
jgi:3-dehydroquinate synthase